MHLDVIIWMKPTNTNNPPKALSTKGNKHLGIIASSERGQLTTIISYCNAAGSFLPPFLNFFQKEDATMNY